MAATQRLQTLRKSIPGCRTLAYVDLSARLVLRADAAPAAPQEVLDALCLRAARVLVGPAAAAADAVLGAPPTEAIAWGAGAIELYLRAPDAPDEALCAILDAAADPDPAMATLREGIGGIVPADQPGAPR
ncbi:hypothetical protein SAMN05444722_1938 [Rhodovulum sp. ES.010]|uniref:hypothetical protein n=1 Tax=Rhodovulum sp. ES.010 TaxID=1882821 RepID=UPI000928B56B|nr:hypothetical protein [Rhodovulum sp. ES.010]SIO40643.1 hypothetical protein SAMN05444722_1938 [Rhodovulum sp. ES.010]